METQLVVYDTEPLKQFGRALEELSHAFSLSLRPVMESIGKSAKSLHENCWALYRRAGSPYGESETGLRRWIETDIAPLVRGRLQKMLVAFLVIAGVFGLIATAYLCGWLTRIPEILRLRSEIQERKEIMIAMASERDALDRGYTDMKRIASEALGAAKEKHFPPTDKYGSTRIETKRGTPTDISKYLPDPDYDDSWIERQTVGYQPPDVKFCPSCNVSVRASVWPQVCPACGTSFGEEWPDLVG